MLLLAASLAVLAAGPLVFALAQGRTAPLRLIDGFVFVAMPGLIFLGIVPESMESGGLWTLLFVIAGFLGPTLVERHFRRASRTTHTVSVLLGMLALCLHATLDGAWLRAPDPGHGGHSHFATAIVLHRLPLSLTVWWLVRPQYGVRAALVILGLVTVGTIIGYAIAPTVTAGFSTRGLAWFQGLVAGSLAHAVFHRPHSAKSGEKSCCAPEEPSCCSQEESSPATISESHDHDHGHEHASRSHCHEPAVETAACHSDGAADEGRQNMYDGVGALLGVVLLALLMGEDAVGHHDHTAAGVMDTFLSLALKSAPALALGFLMAGLMGTFLPMSSVNWLRRGARWTRAARGVILGLPVPICSCGVIPLYRTLIQRGAPPTAAMAFLIATPELGIDAVLLSFPLLGTSMTLVRVVAAGALALLVGWLVGRFTPGHAPPETSETHQSVRRPLAVRLVDSLKLGFGEVVDHTGPWILLGLFIAAIAAPILDDGWLTRLPRGLDVAIFAFLGVPMYVCASGATPFVSVLLASGVSPGAGLAFLLTGPATNVTTFGVLGQLHGRRVAAAFSAAMIVLSVAAGLIVNQLPGLATTQLASHSHHHATTVEWLCLYFVGAVFVWSLVRRGPRRFTAAIMAFDESLPPPVPTR